MQPQGAARASDGVLCGAPWSLKSITARAVGTALVHRTLRGTVQAQATGEGGPEVEQSQVK